MEPIVERINNPEGQSFYAARFDSSKPCKTNFWHIHAEYELVYIKNGSGKIHVGSHFSSYQDGMLIFLGPHLPHMPFTNYDYDDNIEVVIQFKESLLKDQLSTFPEFKEIQEVCKRSHSGVLFGPATRERIGDDLIKLVDMPKSIQLCKLLEVLIGLNDRPDQTVMNINGMIAGWKAKDYKRVNMVYDYVAQHYKREIRTKEVAEIIGLTTNSFCRFFKKVNHKSFIQFLNEYRINKAAEIINLRDDSISETMYQSGFNDPSFFNRQFKKIKGVSPSDYKRGIANMWQLGDPTLT